MKTAPYRVVSWCLALGLGALLACSTAFAGPESEPDVRLKAARALADQGKREEALQEFLWCYDHGVEVDAKFARTRDTRVTLFLVSLGKKLPAARTALVERRDALAAKVKADPAKAEKDLLRQLAHLDLVLGDDAAIAQTLALLPRGKASYKAYGSVVLERLVEAKLYAEAAAADDLDEFWAALEKSADQVRRMRRDGKLDDKGEAKVKANALKATLGVELYAGAGDQKLAKRIADLVLVWSDAPEVRQKIVERLRRAGATELAAKYQAPAK